MEKKYPISEIFVSPQGEGCYAGQMQYFIRLAGCSVGKLYPKNRYELFPLNDNQKMIENKLNMMPLLPVYTHKCTSAHELEFPCDTDYRVKERLNIEQLMNRIPVDVEHVCITGGEPLDHDLTTLITYLWHKDKKIHIETSGTVNKHLDQGIWVTLSPKLNCYSSMINRADELKVLIDDNFTTDDLFKMQVMFDDKSFWDIDLVELSKRKPVFIQPINFENSVNNDNLQRCLEWQKQYPSLRISVQLHKVFSACTGELVR
jgi:organic radical activating enzyme